MLLPLLVDQLKLLRKHSFVEILDLLLYLPLGILLLLLATEPFLFLLLQRLKSRNLVRFISLLRVVRLHLFLEIIKLELRLNLHNGCGRIHLLSLPVEWLHIRIYILRVYLIKQNCWHSFLLFALSYFALGR
jgi:hypothetical protein